MTEQSILSDEFLRNLMSAGEVDLLVGVATHNNASTVGPVIQAIRAGLLQHFPRERSVIVNADGGSRDRSSEVVTSAAVGDLPRPLARYALRTLHCISTVYANTPSSEAALRTILAAAELLRAKACAIISPESTGIVPEWIDRLLQPILADECDYLSPVYRRHKFD